MLPFTLADVIVGILVTWVLGLAPAVIARRRNKGPLKRGDANTIAATTCICFALIFFVINLAVGAPHPRFSAAWILVFFVARWIMVRPATEREVEILATAPQSLGSPPSSRPLTRQEIIQKLEELVDHPATSEERRAWARDRLAAFKRRAEKLVGESRGRASVQHSALRIDRRHLRKVGYALAAVVALDVLLAVSGYRLLLKEKIVQPGQSYEAQDWGDLGSFDKPVLACWYWTGRSLIPEAFWYGHGRDARDECSVLHKHKSGE
jgi:hypothetical protein